MDPIAFILIVAGALMIILALCPCMIASQKSKELEDNNEDIRDIPGQ